MTLVHVEGLAKRYPAPRRGWRRQPDLRAVDDVSFTIEAGETLGLVGESGCGKTTVARTLLHLVPPTAGQVRIGDTDVTAVFRNGRRDQILAVRRAVQYVFQDPFLALNPRWTIGLSKTGYIEEAGRCLVMQAMLGNRAVLVILLDSWGKYTRLGDANRIKQWMEARLGTKD